MKIKGLIIIMFFTVLFSLSAQNDSVVYQPKVGLVLSGGGAKGFAHIGVLKVIDSLGIKIDYISGTSMGAIIGALYASGYSGKQLEAIFENQDFDELINDKFPRETKSFYERENAQKYAVSLPFEKFKISLPSALSRGQNVYNLVYQLMMPVNQITDFEKLPIPFFCIATNIETGESLILDKGQLAEAVTASAALPTLFEPVVIDGDILIDGGVTNNFPVEELRRKGMDIIIGVDVQDALKDREFLKSAPDILLQINNFRTINAMNSKVDLTDIYIKPDVADYSIVSFKDGIKIIDKGEETASLYLKEFQAIAKAQNFIKTAVKFPDFKEVKINDISISGLEKYTSSYVKGKLRFRSGETISFNDFSEGVNNLVATNNFDSFLYKFHPSNQGYDLSAKVVEAKNTAFVKFGVHFDQLYKSAALLNLTKKQLLLKNDVLSIDFILGDNIRYNFDYYIDKGFYWSVGLNSKYIGFDSFNSPTGFISDDVYPKVDEIQMSFSEFTHQFFIESLIKKDFALKIGLELKSLKITTNENAFLNAFETLEYTFEDSDFYSFFGSLKFDTIDNKFFPTSGFLFEGGFQYYLASSDFNNNFNGFSIFKSQISKAFSIRDKLSVNIDVQGGFKVGDSNTKALNFGLGGYGSNYFNNYTTFYGYEYFALSGNSFVKLTSTLDYEFFKNHHFNFSANFSNIADDIFLNKTWIELPSYSGYAMGYGLETVFGPIELKYNWAGDLSYSGLIVSVGYWF